MPEIDDRALMVQVPACARISKFSNKPGRNCLPWKSPHIYRISMVWCFSTHQEMPRTVPVLPCPSSRQRQNFMFAAIFMI
jgi:hypothetical protein